MLVSVPRTAADHARLGDAQLVAAARAGDDQAFGTLFERWFDRSYDVAWRIVRNRDTAAEVAQDTFLATWQGLDGLRDPDAFGGWVLRTARNKALNRLQKDGRSGLVDAEEAIDRRGAEAPAPEPGGLLVDAERDDLVWAAAAALGERDASILDLHLRHGLEPAELATALDVTPNNAHQLLFRLRKKLDVSIRSWVLWHGGQPRCDDLAADLAAVGATRFDAATSKRIERHAAGCATCTDDQAAVLAPEAMFAAVPLLPAPLLVRQQVAQALGAQGVPMGSAASGATASATAGPTGAAVGPTVATTAAGTTTGAAIGRAPGRTRAALALTAVAAVLLAVVLVLVLGDDGTEPADEVATAGAEASPDPDPTTTVDFADGPLLTLPTLPAVPGEPGTALLPPTTVPGSAPAPAPPSTTDPTVATPPAPPPPPPSPTTTPTTATTTSTTSPPPPPRIDRFTATERPLGSESCAQTFEVPYRLTWATTDVDQVTLTGAGIGPEARPPTGTAIACLPPRTTPGWQLTASGPGGDTTATAP